MSQEQILVQSVNDYLWWKNCRLEPGTCNDHFKSKGFQTKKKNSIRFSSNHSASSLAVTSYEQVYSSRMCSVLPFPSQISSCYTISFTHRQMRMRWYDDCPSLPRTFRHTVAAAVSFSELCQLTEAAALCNLAAIVNFTVRVSHRPQAVTCMQCRVPPRSGNTGVESW